MTMQIAYSHNLLWSSIEMTTCTLVGELGPWPLRNRVFLMRHGLVSGILDPIRTCRLYYVLLDPNPWPLGGYKPRVLDSRHHLYACHAT